MMLDNLELFLQIVEKGGLAAAGREVGLSPASVSERLVALERHYRAKLLNRTTRAISLTDEGKLLVEGARRLLAEANELEARIKLGAEKISGPVRLSAPEDLGRHAIVPVVDRFLALHPDVSVDINLTDGYVDLVGQGLDFVVRHGVLADSTLKARPLGTNRRLICASPHYLAKRGVPEHPDDLAGHDCIVMRFGQNLDREWNFVVSGKPYRVMVRGQRIANDGGLVRQWCLDGHGVALKSIRDVEHDLTEGRLVEVLGDFSSGATALQLVYAPGLVQPRRVRLLMDMIADALDPRRATQPAS